MSYYTTIRCKCIVKQEYRELVADTIALISHKLDRDIKDQYLKKILNDGSRFYHYFYNKNKWYEKIEEDEMIYSFSVDTGVWQFHVAISNEVDEIEEFLVRFSPRYLEKIDYLEIYDENSVEHFLMGRHDSYLLTDFFVQDFRGEFGIGWSENIFLTL